MEPARIAVSGARGLVGSALTGSLPGATIVRLARPGGGNGDSALFDPEGGSFDTARVEGCDAIVHLAGESIAARRWSAAQKEKILRSRERGTRLIVEGIGRMARKPRVLVCASAIGYYGDRGDEELVETSGPGDDFLSEVARRWEAEAARATSFGVRVVSLRIGIVMARHGGALARMLLPFRLGAGGRLGGGSQWMSWVHLADLVGIIRCAMDREDLAGAINAVSPGPVRNAEFTALLARTLRRPALLPAPAFALRIALGEMADALLLGSQRVIPARLTAAGYAFRFPRLDLALSDLLGR